MPLMDRIHLNDWLTMAEEQRLDFVRNLQASRSDAIAASKQVKVATKSATKNRAKRGVSSANAEKKLASLLKRMSPEDIAAVRLLAGMD